MSRVVHLIVSCTDRKRAKVDRSRKLGDVPPGEPRVRETEWWSRLKRRDQVRSPARDLYCGELWSVSCQLAPALVEREFEVNEWVASAGYGLIPISAEVTAYSATFSSGSANSVVSSLPEGWSPLDYRREWWKSLGRHAGPARGEPRSVKALAQADPRGQIVVVASPDYIRAMEDDLLSAREALADPAALIVVSNTQLSSGHLAKSLIPVDARAQQKLDGTKIAINARAALHLFSTGRTKNLRADKLRRSYEALVKGVPKPKQNEGTKLTDAAVREFIHETLSKHPGMSANPMLRKLREAGFACEQSRFRELHVEVARGREPQASIFIAPKRGKTPTRRNKRLKFFLPDAQDMVDPSFDFDLETRSKDRRPNRDDLYIHQVFRRPVQDGYLVSMGVACGTKGENPKSAKYTQLQRLRLEREQLRTFFRADEYPDGNLEFMGDCGAFTYHREKVPPLTVDEVVGWYERNGFDYGISVDHVILDFDPAYDERLFGKDKVPPEYRERQKITLQLAQEFKRKCSKTDVHPVGVAQGWSPQSYADAVKALQRMGYDYIAVGGLVPLKTPSILASLAAIDEIRRPETKLHLLGITRVEEVTQFTAYGAVSFDSTSPLKRAWNDNRANYHTLEHKYMALRVPQVNDNLKLKRRIEAGEVDFDVARNAEENCLVMLGKFDKGRASVKKTLDALTQYAEIHDPDGQDRSESYREVLEDAPWKNCKCDVCRALGIHVVLFRGAERNRRRGFHNIAILYERLQRELVKAPKKASRVRAPQQEALRLLE